MWVIGGEEVSSSVGEEMQVIGWLGELEEGKGVGVGFAEVKDI